MSKLCLFFNTPSIYRKLIYSTIDRSFDCDWFFGNWDANVKGFDTKCLEHKVAYLPIINPGGRIYYTRGIITLLFKRDYKQYLMIGDVHDIATWLFLFLKKVFFQRKPVYVWTHGWYGKESATERKAKRLFYGYFVDGVFLYGEYAKSLMVNEGIDPSKLYVIHNSLDYDSQLEIRNSIRKTNIYYDHFRNSNKNIVFLGRLTESKRLDLLLKAVAMLKDRGELYNITIIGDGCVRKELDNLAIEYCLDGVTWFYGACYDESVNAEFVFNADLCVSPGNVGLTAIHSMMFGTPVLTHNDFPHQGPEFEAIIEGKTGSYFQNGDINSLSNCISAWFANNQRSREEVRKACMTEIDEKWNPGYQMRVLRSVLMKDSESHAE